MKYIKETLLGRTVLSVAIAVIGMLVLPYASAEESSAEEPVSAVSELKTIDKAIDEAQPLTRPDSELEVGIGRVSADSYEFGNFTGLQDSGAYLISNIQMKKSDKANASYLEIIGRNLGLDNAREVQIKGGAQGNYGFIFEYDELSRLYSDSYQSPYGGMGTTQLIKPAGWDGTIDTTPGGAINAPTLGTTVITTPMMTELAANMKRFNIETKRQTTGLSVNKHLPSGLEVYASFKRDEKNGTRLTGAPLQIGTGGSRGTLLVPEPIDYTTDIIDTAMRYTGEQWQAQVGYYGSLFSNANKSVEFDNLYYNPISTVGGNQLTGRLGQMPDNQFHQINAAAGYTFSEATRLTSNVSTGRMTQNEAFLPYSTANILPATLSLNGKINTTHADIKLHSVLTHGLSLTTGYKYDDRDNRTPINTYTYPTADVTTVPGASNTRRNMPLSKNQQAAYVDMDYHFSTATRLKLGYDFEKITHTFEPTSGDKEQTLKAELKHNFNDMAAGGLALAHSNRNAANYNGADPLYATYSATYLASLCVDPDGVGPLTNTFLYNGVVTACTGTVSATSTATIPFLDTPALRKFFLADRKRDKLNVFANIMPNEKWDMQTSVSYVKERYPDTEAGFGLDRATGWMANMDSNWVVTDSVSGLAFVTWEKYQTDQNGHNGASNATAPAITTLDRQNNTAAFDALTGVTVRTDRSLTLGLGFRVKPGGSYDWGGDVIRSTTTTSTGFEQIGSRLTNILPLPDELTKLTRLELFSNYQVRKNVRLKAKYIFEKYDSTDWAYDGQTLTSSTSFVGSGQTSPDYKVHVLGMTATYQFQ